MNQPESCAFFMGANTPEGFVSLFDDMYDPSDDWRVYLIKGGPGTGKSSMMKQIAKTAQEKGQKVEWIYCSSDPDSLDAVILPGRKVAMMDATAPHVVNPKFPGVVENLVDLGTCWDPETLRRHGDLIRVLTLKNSSFHKQSVKFLGAAGALRADSLHLCRECLDETKAARYAGRLARREFGIPRGTVGTEQRRFLSGITPKGITAFYDTLAAYCNSFYVLKDDAGGVADYILKYLRAYALTGGLDIITCTCPLFPNEKLEHLIIPELSLCFFTQNSSHVLPFEATRTVNTRRFLDLDKYKEYKNRISFNKKASAQLIGESIRILGEAKATHDVLEQQYVSAMDFDKVNQIKERLTKEILG